MHWLIHFVEEKKIAQWVENFWTDAWWEMLLIIWLEYGITKAQVLHPCQYHHQWVQSINKSFLGCFSSYVIDYHKQIKESWPVIFNKSKMGEGGQTDKNKIRNRQTDINKRQNLSISACNKNGANCFRLCLYAFMSVQVVYYGCIALICWHCYGCRDLTCGSCWSSVALQKLSCLSLLYWYSIYCVPIHLTNFLLGHHLYH